jgi:hypothetical protein
MKYLQIFEAILLLGTTSMVYSAAIPSAPLSGINSFAIVDNMGEQYIAATDRGLFLSEDHGHTWAVYEGYRLPATIWKTMVSNGIGYRVPIKPARLLKNAVTISMRKNVRVVMARTDWVKLTQTRR